MPQPSTQSLNLLFDLLAWPGSLSIPSDSAALALVLVLQAEEESSCVVHRARLLVG